MCPIIIILVVAIDFVPWPFVKVVTFIHVQLVYLAFITPIVYDFYNYDIEKTEFVQLFSKFNQVFLAYPA